MTLENEIDIRTMTEWKSGEGKGCLHMVYLRLYPDLEAGLILNGNLYPCRERRILTEIDSGFWADNYGKNEKMQECGAFLGEKLALLMEILNPEKIIIEISSKGIDESLVNIAKETAKKKCLASVFQNCQIVLSGY